MDRLKDIVQREVSGYAPRRGRNGVSYLTMNEDKTVFLVADVAKTPKERIAGSGLMVRLVDNLVVIEQDINDKPLVDALVAAGIPREQIILAYAGEAVPEHADVYGTMHTIPEASR